MSDDKLTDAEEIFSEFQKKKDEQEKPLDVPFESKTAPEPELPSPVEPMLSAPEPEPMLSEPEQEIPSEPEETPMQESQSTDDDSEKHLRNVIYVGTKPIMTYVTATLTQLSGQPTVTIKARGKRITQAVDVSQMIVKRMNSVGYIVSDVRIASDSLTSQDGRQRNVSTIEIDITKPQDN
ncbi:MAG: DNA-binding protein [Nitrosopumilaceae archaeon]